jgi:hypothetical protein
MKFCTSKNIGTFGTFGTVIYNILKINKLKGVKVFQKVFQYKIFWNGRQKVFQKIKKVFQQKNILEHL